MIFSCKGCQDRYPGCHSKCAKYIEEKAEYEKQKAALKSDKEALEYTIAGIRRNRDREARRRRDVRVRRTTF